MDLALQTSMLGFNTLHSTAEVPDYDKGIGVRAGGGMTVDARARAKN